MQKLNINNNTINNDYEESNIQEFMRFANKTYAAPFDKVLKEAKDFMVNINLVTSSTPIYRRLFRIPYMAIYFPTKQFPLLTFYKFC